LRVTLDGREFAIEGPAAVGYADRRLSIEPFTLVAGGERLRVEGDMPLDADAAAGAIRARGTLDISALVAMAAADVPVQADGTLEVDFGIEGTLRRMYPTLEASLREGSIDAPALPDPLTRIEAAVEVAEGALVLDSLTAEWNGAAIEATGRMPLLFVSDIFFRAPFLTDNGALDLRVTDLSLSSIPGTPDGIEGTSMPSRRGSRSRP
jgi:hypothetical protein